MRAGPQASVLCHLRKGGPILHELLPGLSLRCLAHLWCPSRNLELLDSRAACGFDIVSRNVAAAFNTRPDATKNAVIGIIQLAPQLSSVSRSPSPHAECQRNLRQASGAKYRLPPTFNASSSCGRHCRLLDIARCWLSPRGGVRPASDRTIDAPTRA
jgi:hypothetical protein